MNILLFLLLIAAGEAAWFETTQQQQTSSGFQEQETSWQQQDDSLLAENKQLTSAKASLLKSIGDTEAEMRTLGDQLKDAKTAQATALAAEAAKEAAAKAAALAAAAQASKPQENSGNSLGTIVTVLGQTFKNCQLLKVEADGITFSHQDGITKVMYYNLTPALQQRFAAQAQALAQ